MVKKSQNIKKVIVPTDITKISNFWQKRKAKLYQMDLRSFHYKHTADINFIEKIANQQREILLKAGKTGKFQITLHTDFGKRSGLMIPLDKPCDIWDPTTYEYADGENPDNDKYKERIWYNNGKGVVDAFDFVVILDDKDKKQGGKDDENNDCFYDCLKKVLPVQVKERWSTPRKLKTALHIHRDAMVNTEEHLDRIEKWLNIQIHVCGDVERLPKIKAKTNVYLVLKENHYTLLPLGKEKVKGVSYQEREVLVCWFDKEKHTYLCYDGELYTTYAEQEIREYYLNPITAPYLVLKITTANNKKKSSETVLEEVKKKMADMYKEFTSQADQLKDITKGQINIYKYGKLITTALHLFQSLTKTIDSPDPITELEARFHNGCYKGGLLYGKTYKGPLYKHDISSMYPAIMASNMTFPYKRGQFFILTQSELDTWKSDKGGRYFKYGIYRATITKANPDVFRHNPKNYYTHIDMESAYKRGYEIALVEDGDANFLYYDGPSRINGTLLFKPFVDLLFPLKQKHGHTVKYVKQIMNILWGALCQHKKTKRYVNPQTEEKVILEEDEQIYNVITHSDTLMKINTVKDGDYYVSGFGRIGSFITAQGRKKISELILSNVVGSNTTSIIRVHTDSIFSSKPLINSYKNKDQCGLGQLGYEGYCEEGEVFHANKVEGEFVFTHL